MYQLTILEVEDTGESTPQGVLLALVGPEPEHDQEPVRTLRMYNLASIISLAKWAISQKVLPVNVMDSTVADIDLGRKTCRPEETGNMAPTTNTSEETQTAKQPSQRFEISRVGQFAPS